MEGLTFMWLLLTSGIAFAALMDGRMHPHNTLRRFAWLGVLAVVVFGFAFGIAGA